MTKNSLYWGIGITVVWLTVIISFWIFGGLSSPDSLNELGDFLAGIFAPVAFLWLVLGYVQQGKQLEQNTKALEQQEKALQLQIDEMKESVKQQQQLVSLHQFEHEQRMKSVEPLFLFFDSQVNLIGYGYENDGHEGPDYLLSFIIKNIGSEVKTVYVTNNLKQLINKFEVLSKDNSQKIEIEVDNFEWNKNTLVSEFTITYLNLYGQELSQIFKVEILFDDLKDFDIDNPDEIKINKIN